MPTMKTTDERKFLHAQLKELDEEYQDLQVKAMQAEEHVLAAAADELRELRQRLRRTNRSLSKLFSGPR